MSAAVAIDQGFKTGVERVEVISSPVIEERQATVKQSGKMFNILTRMYSRPVEAGVREIINNAIDANFEAGRPDASVIVKLPKFWDTMFSVRDHGKSMSHDFMMNRYMNLGDSTKETDNNQTGFFGIGSKTPLALVDQYYVTCTQDGHQRVYSITRKTFDGAAGSFDTVPVVGFVTEHPTTEPDGTEVAWAVGKEQANQLHKALTATLAGAAGKATIVVERDGAATHDYDFKGQPKMFGKGWATYDSHVFSQAFGHNRAMIRVGRILYNLNIEAVLSPVPVSDKYSNIVKHLFSQSAIIEVPMSSVQVAPSREDLEYTPTTIKYIYARACEIVDEIVADCKKEVDAAQNIFEATKAFASHAKDHRIVPFLTNAVKWNGKTINAQGVEIPKEFVDFGYQCVPADLIVSSQFSFRPTSQTMRDRSSGNRYVNPNLNLLVYVTQYENKETRFAKQRIAADLKQRGVSIKDTQVLWLRRDDNTNQKPFDDLLDLFAIPKAWIIDVAKLPKYVMPKRTSTGIKAAKSPAACNIRVFTHKVNMGTSGLRMSYLDLNTITSEQVYVELHDQDYGKNRRFTQPNGHNGYEEQVGTIIKVAEKHVPALAGKTIFFIKKDFVDKEIVKRSNWKTLWSYMQAELDKYRTTQADVDAERDFEIKNNSINKMLSDVLGFTTGYTSKSQEFRDLTQLLTKVVQPSYQKSSNFRELNNYLGDKGNTAFKPGASAVSTAWDAVLAKYPLLPQFAELHGCVGHYNHDRKQNFRVILKNYLETI